MRRHGKISLGLAMLLGSPLAAFAQGQPVFAQGAPAAPAPAVVAPAAPTAPAAPAPAPTGTVVMDAPAAAPAPQDPCCGSGPTPLGKVNILQNLLFGECEKPAIHISAWMDFDYTYRSTGSGINNVAPVMNRFGDEALCRQLGVYITKPLDNACWSWGFNVIAIAGADASFLQPTAGGWNNTDPRFGTSFTDLNVTFHMPILTEGGVDVKAGRQTTCLGPMGALPWQRYFDSSDYAWYNMEEGRYTGISTVWHVSKRLDWYNGIEYGGWGVFFDDPVHGFDYLTQVSYWLDEECKNTKAWMTLLTGPTSHIPGKSGLNTTVFEFGIQHNWNECWYQIIDTQMVYSKAPIFGPDQVGYQERAYDVYTYLGRHINNCWDINFRAEWYYDVDGGGYAGGFGIPNTTYWEVTVGPDYHPTKWLQIRPELRYDFANNDAFGRAGNLQKTQFSAAIEALFKF